LESEPSTPPVRFSVIIPVFNRTDLAERAIRSVVEQSTGGDELIVVDDGSNPATAETLRRFSGEYGFQLIRQENSGPGAARNRGAASARGSYLVFLDSDDILLPGALGIYAQLTETHQPSLISAAARFFREESELENLPSTKLRVREYPDYFSSSRNECYIAGGWIVVSREQFTAAGGFPDRNINAEDHHLTLSLGTAPGYLRLQSPYTVGYRLHEANISRVPQKTRDGIAYLISQERQGQYPGGLARQAERRRIISKHARPVSVECLREGAFREGWRIYRELFRWNLFLRQWKYLVGFPCLWLTAVCGLSSRKA
jgi:glycosyltransferase involved in cell wall biosynthesis